MSDTNSLAVLDPRIMAVSVQIRDVIKTYDQRFWIRAKGCKYANNIQNECTVDIANLDTDTRNYLLTATSPFNKNPVPKTLSLYAGRVSTGLFLVYRGDIMTSHIQGQPPDIIIALKCGTKHSAKGKNGTRSGGAKSSLKGLAGGVAANLELSLNFQAKDKTIANYSHSGNVLNEVGNLRETGVNCFVDDHQLVVAETGIPLSGSVIELSEKTGMIGIPTITEQGLKVTFLFNGSVKLGGGIELTSVLNPAANGLFVIYKLNFALASRENEFYYMAECLKAKQ